MSKYDYPDPAQDPAYCDGLGHTQLGRTPRQRCLSCECDYLDPPYPLSYWPYCSRRCELRSGDTRRASAQRRNYFELAVELARQARLSHEKEDTHHV